MPWRCCVPGCRGYDQARARGVVFHGLPTRDPPRCRTWLTAIRNPRFDEHTPVSRYGGVRVCSLHFTPEDYEEDFRARILDVAPKPVLKSGAVPSVFPGREGGGPAGTDASSPAAKRSRSPVSCGAAGTSSSSSSSSSPSPPAAVSEQSFCIVVSVDDLDEFPSRTTSKEEQEEQQEEDKDQEEEDQEEEFFSVVSSRSLMDLFRRCQSCGGRLQQKEAQQRGEQLRVEWSCERGHCGLWTSCPQRQHRTSCPRLRDDR